MISLLGESHVKSVRVQLNRNGMTLSLSLSLSLSLYRVRCVRYERRELTPFRATFRGPSNDDLACKHQKCRRGERARAREPGLQRHCTQPARSKSPGVSVAPSERCVRSHFRISAQGCCPCVRRAAPHFSCDHGVPPHGHDSHHDRYRINGGGWVGGCSVRLPSLRLTLPFVPSLLLLAGRGGQ